MPLITQTQSLWDTLREATLPILLYGMGDGADKILAVCHKKGIPVAGVFASDGFVRGHSFRGFAVESLSAAEERLGDFIVLLAFATQRPEVLAQIARVARRHTLYVPDVPVYGGGLFDLDYAQAHQQQLEEAYSLLCDEQSRLVFRHIVNYKISGDPSFLASCETAPSEAWNTLLCPSAEEVFVDAGAYTGDTIEEFLGYAGGCREILALEPDRRNYKKLLARVERLSLPACQIRCLPVGAWSHKDTLAFHQSSGRQAALAPQEGPSPPNGADTPVDSIDNLLAGRPATLLKYDVEGAEYQALEGSRATIARWRPKLLVSAYHRNEDLFALPLLLRDIYPGCRLFLRHYPYLPAWDTNLYALPGPRVRY